jgi:uncharacterized membrane protein YbhN (UPF0104 family)
MSGMRLTDQSSRSNESGAHEAEVAAQSRSLRNSIITLAVFFGLVAALLLAVPGLRSVGEKITDADAGWLLAAIAFELCSCGGYVVLFWLVFGKLGRRLGSRLALVELAINAVVSLSGLGGLILGGWVLRSKGFSIERIARRSTEMFVITSAVNVIATIVIGVLMWLEVVPGSTDPLLTLAPAAAAVASILITLALATWARRYSERAAQLRPGVAITLRSLSDGIFDVLAMLRRPDPRLLGALGYWLFDTLVLYACLLAYGSSPTFGVVAMAYLVGMLANSLPIPGGLVAVEGGLTGMLLLFKVRPASYVLAAVLTYRAIALWVPSVIGSLAFLSIRREIGKPAEPQAHPAGG